jgi:hypothetical protein
MALLAEHGQRRRLDRARWPGSIRCSSRSREDRRRHPRPRRSSGDSRLFTEALARVWTVGATVILGTRVTALRTDGDRSTAR